MNYLQTRTYIERQLVKLGWELRLDKAGFKRIFQFTHGREDRLDQLYYKLVSVGSRQPKREITEWTVNTAIEDLRRMDEIVEKAKLAGKNGAQSRTELDRYSIDQLAKALETEVALEEKQARIADEKFPKIEPVEIRAEAGASSLPRILVVDDSPTIRAAVVKALKSDFSFVQAGDGEQAWQMLKNDDSIQLVITDLIMPKLDGYELIQRIRADRTSARIAQLPIIVVTTLEDTNAKLRALVAGASDFVTKGTDTVELKMRVMARYKVAQSAKASGPAAQIAAARQPQAAAGATASTAPAAAVRTPQAVPSATPASAAATRAQQGAAAVRSGASPGVGIGNGPTAAGMRQEPHMAKPGTRGPISSAAVTRPNTVLGQDVHPAVRQVADTWAQLRKWFAAVNPLTATTVAATAMVILVIGVIVTMNSPSRRTSPPVATASAPETDAVTSTGAGNSDNTTASALPEPKGATPGKSSSGQSGRTANGAGVSSSGKIAQPAAGPKKDAPVADVAALSPESVPDRVEPKKAPTPDAPAAPAKKSSAQKADSEVGESAGKATAGVSASEDRVVTASVAPAVSSTISQADLNGLIKRFEFVYEAGDIEQFLRLFDDDVRTNDRFSKDGLREDYEDLFKTTDMRRMVLKSVTWEARESSADGWGNFEVRVRKAGEKEVKEYRGSLTFYVEKINGVMRIKRLYHGQWRAS